MIFDFSKNGIFEFCDIKKVLLIPKLIPLDQKLISVKLGAFLKTNLWSKFESDWNMFTMPNHGLNLLQLTNILDFFALKLLSLHKYKFLSKKTFFTQKLFNYLGTF